jgi:N-acetylglutamate synthase-like GNAT family acetyltransferase/anti-sigma regulatory factor (Ser/Thr protein kinase)
MPGTISLRAPNVAEAPELAQSFVASVAGMAKVPWEDGRALTQAAGKLVEFALEHAYLAGTEGEIAVEAHLFDGGVRIDVHDWGLPLELERSRSAGEATNTLLPGLPGLDLGGLVDEMSFHSLGRDGKLFTIVKYCEHDSPVSTSAPLLTDHDDHEHAGTADNLVVRPFEEGDEEAICQLVYRNYERTYGADFFYVPEKLLERNRSGEVISAVAVVDGQIVGHHALLREEAGQLAETGAAVVHPDYKGLGIFNRLAVQTIEDAKRTGLSAVYGQTVTIHPYSQKGVHSHGYRETAINAGRARATIRVEGNELTRSGKRHAIVVMYLCFEKPARRLFLPERYRDMITRTYQEVGVPLEDGPPAAAENGSIVPELDAGLNIGTIAIGRWGDGDEAELGRAFHYLLAKHCDMVYADIDLERVAEVDAVVERLNREGFFYSGLALLERDGCDQLRLQYENTIDVEDDEIACYSDFCGELRDYMLEDRKAVL